MKRLFDIAVATGALILLSPLFPIIAVAVYLGDRGPVIVKLPRVSEDRVVKVYKFRSMVPGAERMKEGLLSLNERNDGPFFKIKDDPRLTGVGRVLRKFRVDELPQFWNVLKGELSMVGPRPHEPQEVAQYPPEYKWLMSARAGLTGLSQINGASSLPYLKELELDASYARDRSLLLDLKIIGKTVLIFLTDHTGV